MPLKVMIISGVLPFTRKSAIIFNPDTNSFNTSVPSLLYERQFFGCAVFKSPAHSLRHVVAVIGGNFQKPAEVCDFTQPNSKWTESKISFISLTSLYALFDKN